MSNTQTHTDTGELSFRDRSDREKIASLTEKYDADTKIGRWARNILAELDPDDAEEGVDDVE